MGFSSQIGIQEAIPPNATPQRLFFEKSTLRGKASQFLDSLAQCVNCMPTYSSHLIHFSSREIPDDGRSARRFLVLLGSQRFCKSPTNRFQRDVQHWLKHRWSAAISRLCSVSDLCSTPQSRFSKPPRAYRLFESRGTVVFDPQPPEVSLGCSSCLFTVGMTRRWQNIGPSKVLMSDEAT